MTDDTMDDDVAKTDEDKDQDAQDAANPDGDHASDDQDSDAAVGDDGVVADEDAAAVAETGDLAGEADAVAAAAATDVEEEDVDESAAADDSADVAADEVDAADDSADLVADEDEAADDSADVVADESDATDDVEDEAADDSADVVADESDAADDVEDLAADEDEAAEDADADEFDTASAAELAAQISELRAEYDQLQQELEASTKSKQIHRPSRRWVSIACVVVGAILLPFSVLARWTASTVLDTDSYVETVAPLAQNEDIQEALSFRVSEIIIEVIDVRELTREALPVRAAFLAGPIESGVRVLIQDVVQELVSTEAFERLWEEANRVGHDSVVAVLTGQGNDQVETAGGKIVLQLGPLAKEVLGTLDDILGLDLADSIPDEQLGGEFVLVQSSDLADLQDEIRWFDRLSWLIPILSIALLVASVVLSRPRRLGFRRLGIAIVASMTISLLLYTWLRGQLINGLSDDIHNPDAATAFFDITTRFLPRDFRVLLVLGVLILFLAWLFGPTGWAGRTRIWWNTLVGKAGDASVDRDVGEGPKWVARNERTLLVAAVALGVLTLVVWTRPTGLVMLLVLVVVGLAMGAVGVLSEIGRRATATEGVIAVEVDAGLVTEIDEDSSTSVQ